MNIKKSGVPLFLVLVLALPSGCATLTRGTTEAYQVISDPAGANVTLSSGETCTTPCTLEKKRGDTFAIKIEKEGYLPYETTVNSENCEVGQMALAGNLLLIGTVVWASIDALNGATQELTPNPCQVKLVPNTANSGG
jgi:hypothetical protein